MKRIFLIAAALALVAAIKAGAMVKPAALFTDNAVLQQKSIVPVWGTADNGEKVTVEIQNRKASTVAKNGKWMVKLAPLKAGGPFTMTITGTNKIELKNILVGEVWLCSGQSNMQFQLFLAINAKDAIASATDSKIRLITIPMTTSYTPVEDVNASWAVCNPDTAANFSAVGYFFGRDLRKDLNVPVGLIGSYWGGTPAESWTSPEGFKELPDYAKWIEEENKKKAEGPSHPSVLYNAMINPLVPYAIKGAIWYQGESNAWLAHKYRTLFPTMIKCWRTAWGEGDFPFLFVQLAPFENVGPKPELVNWGELREAQLLTSLNCPNTGMAVITDYGDPIDIHPKQKEPVGARLALAARKIAYGENIVYSGPIYKSMVVKGNRAILSFDNTGSGLIAKNGDLKGFTIAGADKKFVDASASIVSGNRVAVSSPLVDKPIAVRFGWSNCPDEVNLFNKEDLPASPFRTDDFKMLSQ